MRSTPPPPPAARPVLPPGFVLASDVGRSLDEGDFEAVESFPVAPVALSDPLEEGSPTVSGISMPGAPVLLPPSSAHQPALESLGEPPEPALPPLAMSALSALTPESLRELAAADPGPTDAAPAYSVPDNATSRAPAPLGPAIQITQRAGIQLTPPILALLAFALLVVGVLIGVVIVKMVL